MSDLAVVKVGAHVSVVCYATRESCERIIVRAIVRRIASARTAGISIFFDDRAAWRRGQQAKRLDMRRRQTSPGTSAKTGWIYMDEESRWWARGWKSDAARALVAYVALS